MKGVIHINVSLYFETDLNDEEIDELVSEMDYEFKHPMIQETRINGIID